MFQGFLFLYGIQGIAAELEDVKRQDEPLLEPVGSCFEVKCSVGSKGDRSRSIDKFIGGRFESTRGGHLSPNPNAPEQRRKKTGQSAWGHRIQALDVDFDIPDKPSSVSGTFLIRPEGIYLLGHRAHLQAEH
jgi:hypothetical protein